MLSDFSMEPVHDGFVVIDSEFGSVLQMHRQNNKKLELQGFSNFYYDQ